MVLFWFGFSVKWRTLFISNKSKELPIHFWDAVEKKRESITGSLLSMSPAPRWKGNSCTRLVLRRAVSSYQENHAGSSHSSAEQSDCLRAVGRQAYVDTRSSGRMFTD